MFRDNRYYGHTEVLRRYCGVRGRRPIPGRLQHGWTDGAGFKGDGVFREPWPKLIWSRRNLTVCRTAGYTGVVPIGSPFLYLPPPASLTVTEGARSLLVFPFHGWRKQRLLGDLRSYAGSLEKLARDGFGPVVVCLHWIEYRNADVRAAFERHGCTVTTMGHQEGNEDYLIRQRDLILRHAYASSNRVGTAAFYALAAGRPFFLQGPPMGLELGEDRQGDLFDAWQRSEFPMLTYEGFRDRAHPEVGEVELGLEYKRPPEELAGLLGWNARGLPILLWRRLQKMGWKAQLKIAKLVGEGRV